MRSRLIWIGLDRLAVTALGVFPFLLLKAEVPQSGIDLVRVLAPLRRAFQLLHRFVQASRRGQLYRLGQGTRRSRPFGFGSSAGGGVRRVPAHEPFHQLIVNEEDMLSVGIRHRFSISYFRLSGITCSVSL